MTALSVTASGPAADGVGGRVPELVTERFASRLFDRDPTLWGRDAEHGAARRLSWVRLPRTSRPLVGEVAALRDELLGIGLDRVVLCATGAAALAPEAICVAAGAALPTPLLVLDPTDPAQVARLLETGMQGTVVVVAGPSGAEVELDGTRRAVEAAFTAVRITPAERIVVVTDPGSPLEKEARDLGYRVVSADPDVEPRFAALTAYGLVPSGLAGVDVEALLDDAESVVDLLADDDAANPGLRLGAALAGTEPLRSSVALVPAPDGAALAGWVEQLVAGAAGLRPVVVRDTLDPAGPAAHDVTVVHLAGDDDAEVGDVLRPADASAAEVWVAGSPGALFLLWEVAAATSARLLGRVPFVPLDHDHLDPTVRPTSSSTTTNGAP